MASRRVDVNRAFSIPSTLPKRMEHTIVMNVDSLVPYETRLDGNTIIVTLAAAPLRELSHLRRRLCPRLQRAPRRP